MSRYFRFLAIALTENLKIMTGILVIVFVAGHLFPQNILVSTYYGVMPSVVIMLSLISAAAIAACQLTTVISMGGSRREYFWSIHVQPVVYTVYAVVIAQIFRQFRPEYLGLSVIMQMNLMWIALFTYVAFYLGTAMGILTTKHPFWGVAIVAISCGVVGGFMGYNSVKFIETPSMIPISVVAPIAFVGVVLWNVYLKRYISRFTL